MWIDDIVADGWRFQLESVLTGERPRARLRDELGLAETHRGRVERADGSLFPAGTGFAVLAGWRLGVRSRPGRTSVVGRARD
jgi:hypothetical protein